MSEQKGVNRKSRAEIQKSHKENELNQLIEMNIIDDWLQTYSSARHEKRRNLMKFLSWLGKSAEEVLELRKQDQNRGFEKLCIKYLHYLTEEKNLSVNTAVNKIGTVRSWFRYHDLDLRFKRNELPKTTLKPRKFGLTIDHIRRMLEYANIWEKTLIHLAIETGLRVSDILALKRVDIENLLQQELPSTMEVQTKKEGVLARIFLSRECAEVLRLYLPTLKPNQKRLLVKDEDTLNKSIQRLFKTAFPDFNFKPTMHDFRRVFISTAANLNINEWRIKYFVGKTISPDILTYLRNQDLREDFKKIKTRLTVQASLKAENHELLNEMQVTVSKQQAQINDLETRLEALSKEYKKVLEALETIVPKTWLD